MLDKVVWIGIIYNLTSDTFDCDAGVKNDSYNSLELNTIYEMMNYSTVQNYSHDFLLHIHILFNAHEQRHDHHT